MQKKRPWLSLLIAAVAATAGAAASVASAAGLGASGSVAVLGQPLDFAVQLRLEPGQTLSAECLSAEVTVGDRRVPSAQVRTSFEMQGTEQARVRVRTAQPVDEPVVGVQVQAGCTARVARRYVLLAVPPPRAAAQPTAMAAADAAAAGRSPLPGNLAVATNAAGGLDQTPGSAARDTPRAQRPRNQTRGERRAAAAKANVARADAPRRSRKRPAAASAGPRLRLDPAEPARSEESLAIERAIEVVARAASDARLAASAASAAKVRIATLERTVGDLRTEAQSQRELSLQLRRQLAGADQAGRWVWPLVAAVLVLGGLALWLARRLAALQGAHQARWAAAATAAGAAPAAAGAGASAGAGAGVSRQVTAPIPFVTAEVRVPPAARQPQAPAWPPPAPTEPWDNPAMHATQPLATPAAPPRFVPDPAIQRTDLLPPQVRSRADDTGSSPRDVSIEELIDLEQQAEFFVVLGQDDAAIELLSEHLRNTGGGSPLPYLKLLEIYGHRGDHADYEQIRARFNHRFNAYAPEWGSDLAAGRSLEDYTGILPRLQQAWARPLDAMAEMEALLFRKSRGDLFDLPAYRELLFLYSLARDLLDHEAADTGTVDLLLPLSNDDDRGSEFGSTAPAPYLGSDAERSKERGDSSDHRASLPLDFDLSAEGQRQTSIFDPLDDHGSRVKGR